MSIIVRKLEHLIILNRNVQDYIIYITFIAMDSVDTLKYIFNKII